MTLEGRIFRSVLGGMVIGSFIGAMAALYFFPIPKANETLLTYMLGQLSGFAGAVMAYHYSTTAGSMQKNSLLAQAKEDRKDEHT